jgi:SNF2 family DNA or RNA helicase
MSSNPACKVGLISTMAGNYSLNLARFSVIVFGMAAFDPQVEQQAMCRAWRQGQTRRVEVMYFITAGTYDEAVRKRAEERRIASPSANPDCCSNMWPATLKSQLL